MAHGWDSYFHNLPPLSSDPGTLRRTSESEGTFSQHIENFTGHHDFSGTATTHEAPVPNQSSFNTNYCPNPSLANSNSDCVYQRYCSEAQWQADGEQMDKDFLESGNSDIPDFAADGLPTSESFPSSFATDLQGLKQDCGMLATSFLENYSDVSSCSDADAGETRPSCKYMAGNSFPKPKPDVPTKHSSSEWFFTHTSNMSFPTESLCPNMSVTNEILSSNVKAGEGIVECAQKKMESQEETVRSYAGHNQSSTTSYTVTDTKAETVLDRNDYGGCQDWKQKEDVERNLTQGKYSDISISGHENLFGDGVDKYPGGNQEEQITSAQNIVTTYDNEQEFLNENSTDGHDRNMTEDKQDKCDVQQKERKESDLLEKEISDEHKSPTPNSTNCLNEDMEAAYKENEMQTSTSRSSDPPATTASSSKDTTLQLWECTGTLRSNSHDVESCSQLSEHQSHESAAQENICRSLSESGLQPNSSSIDTDVSPDKECTDAGKTNTVVCPDPDCSGPGGTSDSSIDTSDKQGVVSHAELSLQSYSSSTDANTHLDKKLTDPDGSGPGVTSDHGVAIPQESCLETDSSNTDIHPCLEKESASPAERNSTAFSTGAERNSHDTISDSNKQSVSNTFEPDLQTDSSTDISPPSEKESTSPAGNANTTSSPDEQLSLRKSPMGQQPLSLSEDVAENARESFKESGSSAEEQPVPGMLYGEPLSREDSSCDTDEIVTGQYEETFVAKPDGDSMDQSEGQAPHLLSSVQMRNLLHPVVLLNTLESTNGMSHSYHCTDCQHTTHSVGNLFEHHHGCHSMCNFQFCKTCNVYLTSVEQAEKHLCGVIKESPRLASDSGLQTEGNHHGYHRCHICGLIFSKVIHYIKHMRTHTGKTPFKCNECGLYFAQSSTLLRHKRMPGRCKMSKNGAVFRKTMTASQKDGAQNKPYANMRKCYVKLVDISKTNLCGVGGKSFSSTEKAKHLVYNVHKGVTVSSHQSATKVSDEKTHQVENEIRGKFKCPLCPRLFKYSYNRSRHLRDCVRDAISGDKNKVGGKYRCPLCRATFTLASNRYRHIKASCFRECVSRLAKEKAQSSKTVKEQKTKENEEKTQSKENEQKTQALLNVTAPTCRTVPRFKCSLCPAVFCHASGQYRHQKKHEVFQRTGKMFRYRNSVFSIMSKPETLSRAQTEETKDDLTSAEAKSSLALSCQFCGKCFTTSQSLKKHVRNHRGDKPYRCLECGKGFKQHSHLIGHKVVHQKRIQCTVCRKILPTVGELIQHRSSHLKKGTLECPDCKVQFQYPAQLLRHLPTHKKRENKACELEEKTPLKTEQSVESVKEQNGPKHLQCSLCKEVFKDAHVLRKHCLTHISGSSANQCPFCKRNFNTRRYLLRHMIKHTGDKPFCCTNCGQQFYRNIHFKIHSQKCLSSQNGYPGAESTPKTKRPYQCLYCPRRFCKKDRLQNHHGSHKSNSLLLCSKCGQYFGPTKLGQHQRNCEGTTELNTGSSPPNSNFNKSSSRISQDVPKMPSQPNATKMLQFKCPHCPQRFRYRSLFLRHLVSHTGLQPYPCLRCGHRFPSRILCTQHEALCDGVPKEGLSKLKGDAATKEPSMPTLKEAVQKLKADGEADYKCRFCTKTFIKARSLRRHILTHNEAKPYRCKACDCCFSRYDHLKVHQARCKGRKRRLEVRIPKISLDDVGKGWQSKFGTGPAEKQETFECEVCSRSFPTQTKLSRHFTMFHAIKLFKCSRCGSGFSHEKSLKKHRKMKKCRTTSNETNAPLLRGTNSPADNLRKSLGGIRNPPRQRIQPYFKQKCKYVCSFCPRAFSDSWQLGVHTRMHTGERPFSCDYCGQRFVRKDYVQRHHAKCTKKLKQKKVPCDRCGRLFSAGMLESHKKGCTSAPSSSPSTICQSQQSVSQTPSKGFSCAYCSSRFLLFSQLQEHFLSAHKLETMGPPLSTAPLQQHLSNISKIKEEPLDESCEEGPSDGANLTCKLDTALDSEIPKSFFCSDCNMSFISKAGLAGHLRTHAVGHPFNCKTCSRGFWNKNLLRNHYRKCRNGCVTTKPLEVPLKAEIDSVLVFEEGSTTTGTGVLQTNFSCRDDSMDEAPENSEGNEVQSDSSQERKTVQYQCSECEKSFTDGLMLISHLEDHGRQEQERKRNTCTTCGRVCTSQRYLEKHMKMHGIDKKLSCPDCPKMFYTMFDLVTHRTCHDTSRPYGCKLCNQRFMTRPSLCSHYREDHADDVFDCQFCSKTYAVKKSLTRHVKKWHQKEHKELASAVQEKSTIEQQSSSHVSTTGESDENENNRSEDSDSDSAPYFPCHVCGKTFPTSESLEDHQLCHLGEKPHECAECGKCFVQASQLQQHQRMHKSELQCQICGRGFVSLFALRKHKYTHGKSRSYQCSRCHMSLTGPSQLAEHMSTHHEEIFPCDICDSVFLSKGSRAEHRKSHSKSGDLPPPSVSRGEQEQSASLSESSFVFTTELKYRCGVCSERFKDPEKLSEHGCMQAEERPYSCTDCNKHFLHASHLKKHRNTHHPSESKREYPCNQCNSSFSSSQHFLSHLQSHVEKMKHDTEGEDGATSYGFICPVCHQCFASPIELIHHFPTHSDVTFECEKTTRKPEEHALTSATDYECTECGQSFLGGEAFRQHHCPRQQQAIMETEYSDNASSPPCFQAKVEEEEVDVTGEDLYYCPVCRMQFSSKSGLLEHQNANHPHGKPFKCELCEKTFAKKKYLKEHERRHRQKSTAQSPERKFKCSQCRAKFSTAEDLSLHKRLHSIGEYRCDMCYKSFSHLSHLKQHQESHVGEVVYECTECDKAFAFPHLLEEHQQTHAGSSQ